MLQLYALVDYFNVAPLRRGGEASYSDHLSAVEQLMTAILQACTMLDPKPQELRIRLYGGWHSSVSNSPTEAHDILGTIARRYFPTRKPLRVFLELADSLLILPTEHFTHTLRYWRGLAPFTLGEITDLCPLDPATCPLHELMHWRRGRCPRVDSCKLQAADVLASVRQKMVDTSLVADTIVLALETDAWIAPMSNDDDVLPGLLVARRHSSRVMLARYRRLKPSPYDPILERQDVSYIDL